MFSEFINDTVWTSPQASSCLSNITSEGNCPDESFLSTLRALLVNRIGTDQLQLVKLVWGEIRIRNAIDRGFPNSERKLRVVECDSNVSGEFFDDIPNRVAANERLQAWKYDTTLTEFFRKGVKVRCFTNAADHACVVITDKMDIKIWHFLQAAIPRYLPWYFQSAPVTEAERAVCNSLIVRDKQGGSGPYIAALNAIAENMDFETTFMKRALNDFLTSNLQMRRDDIMVRLETLHQEVRQYQRMIRDHMSDIADASIRLEGVRASLERSEDASELIEFFTGNPHLQLLSAQNGELVFAVGGEMVQFDETAMERAIENHQSALYAGFPSDEQADMELLYRAICITRRVRLRIAAEYRMSCSGVDGVENEDLRGTKFAGYMPNPHINHYNCFGEAGVSINDSIEAREYPLAIDQITSLTCGLNFTDGTVLSHFSAELYSDRYPECLTLEDGTVVTTSEAIAWLKEHGEE